MFGCTRYQLCSPLNLPDGSALAILRSNDASAVLTYATDVDVPVKTTASKSAGYLVVTPCVTVEPAECPHPDHAREAVAATPALSAAAPRARARSPPGAEPCTTCSGSGCSDLPTPIRSYEKVAYPAATAVVDVAVPGGDVPVGAVQGVPVRQELDCLDGRGGAGRGRDAELAVDGESIFDRGRATVYSREERAVGFQQLD